MLLAASMDISPAELELAAHDLSIYRVSNTDNLILSR